MAGRVSIPREISAWLGSAEAAHELHRFAEQVAEHARSLAPVFGETGRDERRSAPPEGEPGDFRDSIQVFSSDKVGHLRVGSKSKIALWQEIGTRHFPELAIFAKTAKYFGGTGPTFEQGVAHAQSHLRDELEKLGKLAAEGVGADRLAAQHKAVAEARQARSSAFTAARAGRRRRRR